MGFPSIYIFYRLGQQLFQFLLRAFVLNLLGLDLLDNTLLSWDFTRCVIFGLYAFGLGG